MYSYLLEYLQQPVDNTHNNLLEVYKLFPTSLVLKVTFLFDFYRFKKTFPILFAQNVKL